MRSWVAVLGLLAVAGCAAAGSASYDPHLYDANGNVVMPVAAAAPPPPPPAAAAPECRDSQRTVTIGGVPRTATATACRQPDGSWRLVD